MNQPGNNLDDIAREHSALISAYGRTQQRCSELMSSQSAQIVVMEAEIMRLRAQVIRRDTELAWTRADMAELSAAIPGLPTRMRLARRVEWLSERIQDVMREGLAGQWSRKPALAEAAGDPRVLADLREKAVLCIGQDGGAATEARQAVENAGGRFLHHGVSDDDATLENSLAEADLVICQTGCVSHGAYWRVQDHCKRTGKQCVLVERPQAMHFVRKLEDALP